MGDERLYLDLEIESESEVWGRGFAMDTPERHQITTPLSKFEDSPVFNYINNLSPIQPVKSVHITQTFNSVTFTSLPSVFTSPHVSSLKESRFLKRHHTPDPSKAEFSSENGNKVGIGEKIVDVACNSADQQENFDLRSYVGGASVEPSYECSKHSIELSQNLRHESVSSEKLSLGTEVHMKGISQMDENEEAAGCDWEYLLTQPLEDGDMRAIVENQDIFAGTSLENCTAGYSSEKLNNEPASNLHRGTRKRCLVFEMMGARRKRFDDSSSCGSSILMESQGSIASNDKHLVPLKPGNDPSRRIVPGIGLHLNTLATSMDQKLVKYEALASGGLIISSPQPVATFHSLTTAQEPSNNIANASSSERDTGPAEDRVPVVENASHASGYANEEFSQSSPKKKRRRLEHAGESEVCKRCNCKKSKCLKLYCECFAAGVYCVEPCSCQECFNKPIHEDTVLAARKLIESRNPLAFAPKVIRSSDTTLEIGEESSKATPSSARHKRGCNCKKSGCLKKYCECYQGGVGCSINCRCEGCKNAFGRKDGSTLISTEAELGEEEIDQRERSVDDRALPKNAVSNETEQNTYSALPATPLRSGRPSTHLPFSKSKPPRSSFLAIGSSSSGLYAASNRFGSLKSVQPPTVFEKHFQTVGEEDEVPEILQVNGSPGGGVHSSSPNSKRVSPPHCDIGLSPDRRSSRKLILQSIPSFPSLTYKELHKSPRDWSPTPMDYFGFGL